MKQFFIKTVTLFSAFILSISVLSSCGISDYVIREDSYTYQDSDEILSFVTEQETSSKEALDFEISKPEESTAKPITEKPEQTSTKPIETKPSATKPKNTTEALIQQPDDNIVKIVYITKTGKKYHSRATCPGLSNAKAIYEATLSQALQKGLDPCSRCH